LYNEELEKNEEEMVLEFEFDFTQPEYSSMINEEYKAAFVGYTYHCS